ncbi:uncharacterized protein LOC131225217 [Magnolia sinica]|uniref:uncharacterized protein LOC131225217 n=1 Tax=Magnolia sinica TaxID=86752 RepID=UPI00265809CC|nr:uncharacterized protein LOC131225217 [Magnolia sinica]
MSSNRSPIFPMPQPHHFSDYGFDPQIDYFQILEEARQVRRETRPVEEALDFKLQKPISREEIKKTKKRKWWNALSFWKWERREDQRQQQQHHHLPRRAFSGPVYETESGSSTPNRSSRPSSGPLAGSLTPTRSGDLETPYLNLREMNPDAQQHRVSTSSLPVYFVT